jgi:hypothetical protein
VNIRQLIRELEQIAREHGDIEVQKQLRGASQAVPIGRPIIYEEYDRIPLFQCWRTSTAREIKKKVVVL